MTLSQDKKTADKTFKVHLHLSLVEYSVDKELCWIRLSGSRQREVVLHPFDAVYPLH